MRPIIIILLLVFFVYSTKTDTCTSANLPNILHKNYTLTSNTCFIQAKECCMMTLNYTLPSNNPIIDGFPFNETYCVLLNVNGTDQQTLTNLESTIISYFSNETNYTWNTALPQYNLTYMAIGLNFNPPLFWSYYQLGMPNKTANYSSSNPFNIFAKLECGNIATSQSTFYIWKQSKIYFILLIISLFLY